MTPGSAASMANWLPLNGKLVPRSRLSSMNTIRSMLTIIGITPKYESDFQTNSLWVSDATRHGVINSNGSISVGSFVSAFGLGVSGIVSTLGHWNYATIFLPGPDDFILVAAGGGFSANSLICAYQLPGDPIRYSYLTSAPKAAYVTTFDNYLVAWHVDEPGGTTNFVTRVQWCVRGSPSNWTGEGSGFEDLLEMRGVGNRVIGTQDNRLILFTNHEIWYGLTATYPAQFQFYPLDRTIGLFASMTVQETDLGILFVGSDLNVRILPRGGGESRVFAPQMREAIQQVFAGVGGTAGSRSWAVFDPIQRLYYLYLDKSLADTYSGFVLNVDTGEWGRITHPQVTPRIGCSLTAPSNGGVLNSSLYFGNSTGTVYSHNSLLITEDGSTVTATWQSPPVATDLPGNWKQLTQVDLDHRSFSTGTVVLKVSTDGGNTFESTGRTVALPRAPMSGRATSQMYLGGAFPALEVASSSTGVELHRLDVTMSLGGRGG